MSPMIKLIYSNLKERLDSGANFDAINHRKRHDSSSGSSDEEEEEDGGAEFRRKKRRSEGGRHARERLQETPSYTGGVSRDAKERQVRHYTHFPTKRRILSKMTADGGSWRVIIVINFQRWFE